MIAVLYTPTVRIFEEIHFFQSDNCRVFTSFAAEKRFCVGQVGAPDCLKKEIVAMN